MNLLISIIIPTYNRAHLIGETLDSVLVQTYTNWECIVVDDGSTDETQKLLETYIERDNRFQYHKRPKTHLSGGNGARNYGFSLSKGDYIHWFDSDDIMVATKLEKCIYEIETKKKDLVVSNFAILNNKEKTNSLGFNDLFKFHVSSGTINTPMCFFRKTVLIGYTFNETLVRSQEFEFFTRLFGTKTIDFSVINEPLSKIRSHSDSITGNFEKGDENAIASMLFAKLSAVNLSVNLDTETKAIASQHFERALWKSLIFRHQRTYWKYLKLYAKGYKHISIFKCFKFSVLALLFFEFNRGGQVIRKQFLK